MEQITKLLEENAKILQDHTDKLERIMLRIDDQNKRIASLPPNTLKTDMQFDKLRLTLLDMQDSIKKMEETGATKEDIHLITRTLDAHTVMLQRLDQERLSAVSHTDRLEETITSHEKILTKFQAGLAANAT